MEASGNGTPETHDCVIKLRLNPQRRKDKVVIGCGAGFGGDRPIAALKLLQRVKELDYLVLECLAERTLAERYSAMEFGGKGYDPRRLDNQLKYVDGVRFWHSLLSLVYLGAAPIVECLERYTPDVIITSRVADASLFLGPMVFELGWNWDELQLLAQGSLAGHLLECGCQLTGGYYMHPGDKYRSMSFQNLLDLSLPFAEVTFDGTVCVAKAESTGGVLDFSTCAQQLLYEVGDPSAYITPDVVGREYVRWQISVARNSIISSTDKSASRLVTKQSYAWLESDSTPVPRETVHSASQESIAQETRLSAAPTGQRIPLYDVAHSRAGDKGNDLNFSIIPHYRPDIERLKTIVTPEWVKEVVSPLLNPSSFPGSKDIERRDKWVNEHIKVEIYEVKGINSLNVVVRNILDGGVNCSRRIDRHGKTISDVVLCQKVVLPP
ncbi:UNVERIFIED_CONTAM: hypothetical protein Sradi_3280800 [Sesamum radiatum]|uniref:Uncharacterized protein n=1 Tax=Sesamum radiatum TaxID=300843 RepID=A0AAW2R167_SESRA